MHVSTAIKARSLSLGVLVLTLTLVGRAAAGEQAPTSQATSQPPSAAEAAAAEPKPTKEAVLFGKKCGSCHTLGEGDRVGPDLLGVLGRRPRAWVERFIDDPDTVIDSGDAVANELLRKFKGVRMPDPNLNPEQTRGILEYVAACTGLGRCKIVLGAIKHAREATAVDVEMGRQLFVGERRLKNGGPPCASCHTVYGLPLLGGGTLAKDLSTSYGRLGDAPMSAALQNTPFALMADIFSKKPLEDTEVFHVKGFLASVLRHGVAARPDHDFGYLGVAGLLASLVVIGAAWSGRMRGVRREVVRRGRP